MAQDAPDESHPVDPFGRPAIGWLFVSVIAHLAIYLCVMILATPTGHPLLLHQRAGDESDYVVPAERLLATGDYASDPSSPESRVHRMPGYAFTYAAFRVWFGGAFARSALVLFQVFLGGIAAYVAALLAYRVTRRSAAFYAALLLGCLPSFGVIWNSYILPDGLSASVLVAAVLLLFQPGRRPHVGLAVSGALWAYSLFLRPYLAALVIPFVAYVWVSERARGRSRRHAAFAVALFLAVPVIADATWVIRNWMWTGRLVPLHMAGFGPSSPVSDAKAWLKSFGGDIVWWRPGTAGAWLYDSPFAAPGFSLPEAVVSSCGTSEIASARAAFVSYLRGPREARAEAGRIASAALRRCRQEYEVKAPFDHEVTARARLFRLFLVHAGPSLPTPRWQSLSPFSLGFLLKLAAAVAYALTIGLGLPGIVVLGSQRSREALLLVALASFPLVIFPFVLRLVETRYWTSTYPFLVIAGASAAAELVRRVRGPGASAAGRI